MVELPNFDIVCCKVPILISTVDDQGYLSNYSSFSLVFVEDLCTQYYTCQIKHCTFNAKYFSFSLVGWCENHFAQLSALPYSTTKQTKAFYRATGCIPIQGRIQFHD